MSRTALRALAALALLPLITPVLPSSAAAQELNIYTYREPALIKPLLDEFTAETGIKVNTVFAADGLDQRIATEGANSPADLLITVDIARLSKAVEMGITQPVKSDVLEKEIQDHLQDPGGNWLGLGMRVRVRYAYKTR